jgi:molybdopterin-guanine dinucleotide biosynthesis protein A
MGRDKALLPWGDTDLLGHTLRRLSRGLTHRRLGPTSAETAVLSGSSHRFADRGVHVYPDIVIDAGPLGGILTGLASVKADLGLFLAVDLPLITVPFLEYLLTLAPDHDAVVPLSPSGPEPLCAVYTRTCAEPIRNRIARGELKMTSFWPDVRVRRVEPHEIAAFGDPATLFLNVNSPSDYERARALGEGPG